jgi:uncharacterized protein YbjT (DUF2867 family)
MNHPTKSPQSMNEATMTIANPTDDSAPLTLAVIGGSRGTGRAVVDMAHAAGHRVRLLARSRPAGDLDGIEVLQGDARDPEAVREAVRGADAVVIALGGQPSDRTRPRTRGTLATIKAMRAEGVGRVVALSVLGAAESGAHVDWFTRRIVLDLWLRHPVADHESQEAALEASGLDWTAVRPPHLTDGPRSEALQVGFPVDARPPAMKVARADVAAVLLDCALNGTHSRRAVGVAG